MGVSEAGSWLAGSPVQEYRVKGFSASGSNPKGGSLEPELVRRYQRNVDGSCRAMSWLCRDTPPFLGLNNLA